MKERPVIKGCFDVFEKVRTRAPGQLPALAGFWSYPALCREGGRLVWLCLVMGTVPMPGKGRTALFRPRAAATIDPISGELLGTSNFAEGHDPFPSAGWDEPVAMFPHRAVGDMTYQDFSMRERDLLEQYPAAMDVFLARRELPAEFVKSFRDLTHPVFLPYLRHITPPFFAALGLEA